MIGTLEKRISNIEENDREQIKLLTERVDDIEEFLIRRTRRFYRW